MHDIVTFGTKAFRIVGAQWDKKRQIAVINFEDDNGISYKAESLGISLKEQRKAVFDAVKDAWINAQADDVGQTGASLMKQLALACGNHPYEDGEIF